MLRLRESRSVSFTGSTTGSTPKITGEHMVVEYQDIADPKFEEVILDTLRAAGIAAYRDDDVIKADNVSAGTGDGSVCISLDVVAINKGRLLKISTCVGVSKDSTKAVVAAQFGNDRTWLPKFETLELTSLGVHGVFANTYLFCDHLSKDELKYTVSTFVAEVDAIDNDMREYLSEPPAATLQQRSFNQ